MASSCFPFEQFLDKIQKNSSFFSGNLPLTKLHKVRNERTTLCQVHSCHRKWKCDNPRPQWLFLFNRHHSKAKLCCSSACQALVCVQTISRGGAGGVLSKYLYATILYIFTLLRCAFSTLHIIILWIVRSSLEDKQLGSMYSSLRR